MNYESGPSSSSLGAERPDKPLVVKCEYNARQHKLTFKSARFCTYDGLREKIEEHFYLVPRSFAIQWKDDCGELNFIDNESALNEAIDYYHSGDDSSVTSSGPAFLSRSSSRHHKITMYVQIRMDYDGPSLSESDTSSLASREDPFEEGSQVSFSAGELSSSPQDDDAVTVSSKDSGLPRQGRADSSSLIKKFLNGTSRAGGSSSQSRLLQKPSRSRILSFRSRVSSAEDEATESGTRDVRTNSDSLTDTERAYPDDPSAVLERLRLEDQQRPSLSHQRSILNTDMGQAWLKEQNTHRIAARLGPVPAHSISDDFSLNTDTPLSDGDPNDIKLEKDERGKYFYQYIGSGSSESAGDLDYELVNVGHPNNGTGIPHDLLVPEEVSDCSECGRILDQIKYICTTCGEKTPTSRAALATAAAVGEGKGKSRSSPDYHHHEYPAEYGLQEPAYPPRTHRSPAMPYSFSNSPNASMYSSSSKPLPALPSTSPTQTIFGRSLGSQSTLVPQSSSGSSSSLTRTGYELCAMCFEKVGVDHSASGGVESPSSPTFPRTAQEISIARRTAPKQKGQLRHAFFEQVWGFNGWQDVEHDEVSHRCSVCQATLSGTRYKCITDECDLTICRGCFSDVHNIHPIHPFLEMRIKPVSRSSSFQGLSNGNGTYESTDEPSLKHPGVQCFNCQQDIVGARFRCVDCTTIDIDICSNCETAGLPGNLDASDGGHNSSHIMLKIPVPLDMHDVQHVSQRAHGLRHGRDSADLPGLSSLKRSSPGSVSSISAGTVSYGDGGPADIEEDYVHLQLCNSCAEPIIGIRYQCLNCPSKPHSYNLCSDCELKSYRVHDPMHTFLKIPRPVDIPGPLESEFPIIPVLYQSPAGPAPGTPSAEISGDPAAYLQDVTHAYAFCDRHMKRIVGKWFRCAFCAKDLCADCELLDAHDSTHVFLVFKAPVDMQAFRHFADLESANGSPPVLRAKIYYSRHV